MLNRSFKAYFFLGAPGSGKGTQIKILAEKLGLYHYISSKIGNEYIKDHPEDPTSIEQKRRTESGLLWEAEWMFDVGKKKTLELINNPEVKGIIFDGAPRTLFEAEGLYALLAEKIGKENLKIINLNINEEELLERIDKRIICSVGADHVFIRSEELKEGVTCPNGDGTLIKRPMDDPKIFKVRLDAYRNETVPGLEYLRTQHQVIDINGDQPIEKVQSDILEKLSNPCETC